MLNTNKQKTKKAYHACVAALGVDSLFVGEVYVGQAQLLAVVSEACARQEKAQRQACLHVAGTQPARNAPVVMVLTLQNGRVTAQVTFSHVTLSHYRIGTL